MRHYNGRWDEDRGDKSAWQGASDWYFEVEPKKTVVRQMEVYDAGVVQQYDQLHLEVRLGGLTDKPFDAAGFPVAEIARDDFERAWSTHAAANRHPRGTALGVNWLAGFDFQIKVTHSIRNGKRLIGVEGRAKRRLSKPAAPQRPLTPASTFWRRVSTTRLEHQIGRFLSIFEERLARRA